MSLTAYDLNEIRNVVESALAKQTDEITKPIQGELQALGNDIKEIYDMIAKLQKVAISNSSFEKLSLEKKILQLHSQLLQAAKQAGVTLPSQ